MMETAKRKGRPRKPPMPSLPYEKVLKIRNAITQAVRDAPDEVKLRQESPLLFEKVIQELSSAIRRFFAVGYEIRDGIELIQELELDLSDSEIKSILLHAQL